MSERIEIDRLMDDGCPHDVEVKAEREECYLCDGDGWVQDHDDGGTLECPLCEGGLI